MVEISVIVPALNEEGFIENTLKSLRSQKFDGKYEIIVADGQSEDRTVELAKKFADKVVVCPNRGAGRQRNHATKFASGKILAFIDSDTLADPNWLKSIKESFSNDKVVATVGTLWPMEENVNKGIYDLANILQRGLVKIRMPLFWGASCAFRREAFEKVGGFDERLSMSEDHDISLRIKDHGKVVFNKQMIAYTSNRRFESKDGWILYILEGLGYFLFKKSKQYVPVKPYNPQKAMSLK